MREKVQAGVRAGVFKSDNAELVSQIIWSSVHGLTSLLISRPEFPWEPKKALIETLADTMLTGLFHKSPKDTKPHASHAHHTFFPPIISSLASHSARSF